MKLLRVLVALALAVAVVMVITRRIAPRAQCNREKGRINRDVRRFGRIGYEYDRFMMARRNLASLQQCTMLFPEDYQLHILRGGNLRILRSYDESVRAFEDALKLAQRPEIYAQIAEVEIERGNIEAARAAMMKAATFNIMYVEMVADPLREEVAKAVYARHAQLREAKMKQ